MSTFALGQRWVSHADVELGLGIIVELEGRRVTLHFPAVGEDRTYATDRAPLTRLVLNVGDMLQHVDGSGHNVLSVEEADGVKFYLTGERGLVSELDIDPYIRLSSPKDRLLNNQLDKPADFKLRYATLRHRANNISSSVAGLLGARTSLLSHQIYIAREVGKRFSPRVLLADEVGLGKTIEAGLILSQQLASGRATRVLIIVPDTLIHQWLVEMLRRFNLAFSLFTETRFEDADEDIAFDSEQLILSPFSLFNDSPTACEGALSADWDLVIVDEAHHLNTDGASDTLFGFISRLAKLTRGLLLLTATPEQTGVEGHFERLQLLDPDRFSDFDRFTEEQQRYNEWSDVIKALQEGESAPELPDGIDPTLDPGAQIQLILDRYGTGRVLFRNTRNSIAGFPDRKLIDYPLSLPSTYEQARHLLNPESIFSSDEWLRLDPRVAWLEEKLRELRPKKVLVIAHSSATALALEHHLHLRAGIRCAAFHEGLSLVERDRAAAFFADDVGGAQALICSEIGSEGRNSQFAHHLICFDLPANPDLLEQRIGRLDRIGQSADVIVHIPYIQGTAQEVQFRWLDQGLSAFTHSCAVGHAVYTHCRSQLEAARQSPLGASLDTLIEETRRHTETLEAAMQQGRDRLLELNSHDPVAAASTISAIEESEDPQGILEFAELLFDRIGIQQDYHSDSSWVLKPTEMLITGDLPGLEEDGMTVTFDRSAAVARDDIHFLTWEHPLLREAMDIVASSELGNSSLVTLKHPRISAGTVLLEVVFGIDCLAPSELEIGRFLDLTPLRYVVAPNGKEVGKNISHDVLNQHSESIPATMSANVIRQIRSELERQLDKATQLAEISLTNRIDHATIACSASLSEEVDRLRYLSRVNDAISPLEIDTLKTRMSHSDRAIKDSRVHLEAIRVVVAV